MLTIYARKERTADALTLQQPAPLSPAQRDVVIYSGADATKPIGRYPWHFTMTKPTRRNRYLRLNCARYELQWLPDLAGARP